MKVCAKCFSDKELKSFISSSAEVGDCQNCGSISQRQRSIDELQDFFQELLENFSVVQDGLAFSTIIQRDWNLFSSAYTAEAVLKLILPKINTPILDPAILVDYREDILENQNLWEVLKEELKWKNRFVINMERLEEFGWDGFFNTQYTLDRNIRLYRARLHHQSGSTVYNSMEMTCPPKELVKGGRANPSGIPYLYLSGHEDTVLYEIRATFLDELSLGTFQLNPNTDSVKLVDFTEEVSLFQPNSGSINKIIKGKLLRKSISLDLSKPMRRYDSELDYVPTQFICEYLRIITGAQGVRFESSLHPKGKIIVLFDTELMICESVKGMKINTIELAGVDMIN